MGKINVYQIVTDKIIEKLEQGEIPWKKPWVTVGNTVDLNNMAYSRSTKKPYSVLNQILLGKHGEYLTFNQVKELGGKVKKGAKSQMVVFFKPITVKSKTTNEQGGDEEITKQVPYLQYYNVFHIDQTENIEPLKIEETDKKVKLEKNLQAEEIVKNYIHKTGVRLKELISNKAFYDPNSDSVTIPLISQFKNLAEYYSTIFHELAHSTGHETRLNRLKPAKFKSKEYSKEELIAEISSSFLLSMTNLETEISFSNNVAYLQSWIKVLKNDNKMIVSAASQAEKATKLIIGL